MSQASTTICKYRASNIANDCPPSVATNEFFEDLRVILNATKSIKNPTVNKKILDLCLSALAAKYAEYKISCLIETHLTTTLNRVSHHV